MVDAHISCSPPTFDIYRGCQKMYTHFKICYLCITFRSCSRTFAQKMALIKWMLASPSERQDSHRYKLSITMLIQFFPFLICVYFFFGTLCTYTHTHTRTRTHARGQCKRIQFWGCWHQFSCPFLGQPVSYKSVHVAVDILGPFDPHACSSHFFHMICLFVAHVLAICSTRYVVCAPFSSHLFCMLCPSVPHVLGIYSIISSHLFLMPKQ